MEIVDTHSHLYLESFDDDREQVIRNVAAFLRWGTGYESNYLLPEKWKPFAKGDAGSFIGKKSGEDIKVE